MFAEDHSLQAVLLFKVSDSAEDFVKVGVSLDGVEGEISPSLPPSVLPACLPACDVYERACAQLTSWFKSLVGG